MVGMYPVGPVTEGIGLNITVMSYCGMVYFGLNACHERRCRTCRCPSLLQEWLADACFRGARLRTRTARSETCTTTRPRRPSGAPRPESGGGATCRPENEEAHVCLVAEQCGGNDLVAVRAGILHRSKQAF